MRFNTHYGILLFLGLAAQTLLAQAGPVGTRPVDVSTFAAIGHADMGVEQAQNSYFEAGADIHFYQFAHWSPAIEVEGSTPISASNVVREKEVLVGAQFARTTGSVWPFVSLLGGRAQLEYPGNGVAVPGRNISYTKSAGNIVSPALGLLIRPEGRFSFRVETRFDVVSVPVTTSDHTLQTSITLGFVYHPLPGRTITSLKKER